MTDRGTRKQLGFFLLGFGAFLGVCGWSMINQAKKSVYEIDTWTRARATVVSAEVESDTARNTSSTGPSMVTVYRPAVTYRYTIEGREYSSDRYTVMDPQRRDMGEVREIVESYAAGKEVTAYVNPEDPSEAVLSREDKGPSIGLLVGGWAAAVIGAALAAAGTVLLGTLFTAGGDAAR